MVTLTSSFPCGLPEGRLSWRARVARSPMSTSSRTSMSLSLAEPMRGLVPSSEPAWTMSMWRVWSSMRPDGKGMTRVWSQKGEVSPSSSTRVEHL